MCSTMFIAGLFVKSQIIENNPDVPQQKNGYRAISHKEIEEVIKNHPTKGKKRPGPDRFSTEFCQTFKKDLIAIFLELFHKIEREGTLPNSFCEVPVTLIPKACKDSTKNENFIPIWLIDFNAKILSKIFTNRN